MDVAHSRFKIDGAGHMGRRHFSQAMADDHVRHDAAMAPKSSQRDLKRADRRLGHGGAVDLRRGFVLHHGIDNRPAGQRFKHGVEVFDGSAIDRFVFEQAAAHGPPLAALARERERYFAIALFVTADHGCGCIVYGLAYGLTFGEGFELGFEACCIGRNEHRAAAEVVAPVCDRTREFGQLNAGKRRIV